MPTWQPKPKRTGSDFDLDFSNLIEALFPDTIPTGWPRYRRGNSPRNWNVEGGYNFVDPNGYLQVGVYKNVPEFRVNENVVDIPFTVEFSGRPIVFAQAREVSIVTPWVTWRLAPQRAYFRLSWESGAVQDWITFSWLAYGPGAGILEPGRVINV